MRPSVVVKIPKSIEMGLGIPQILVQLTLYASLPERLIHPFLLALCLRMFNPSMNYQDAPFHHPYFILGESGALDRSPWIAIVAQNYLWHTVFLMKRAYLIHNDPRLEGKLKLQ